MVTLCNKHGKYPWYGGIVPVQTCTVCQLEQENERLKERLKDVDVCNKHRTSHQDEPAHPDDCVMCEIERLKESLAHARASLRHIARTCIEDPETAQFASRASDDPPSAFPPAEDVDRG